MTAAIKLIQKKKLVHSQKNRQTHIHKILYQVLIYITYKKEKTITKQTTNKNGYELWLFYCRETLTIFFYPFLFDIVKIKMCTHIAAY